MIKINLTNSILFALVAAPVSASIAYLTQASWTNSAAGQSFATVQQTVLADAIALEERKANLIVYGMEPQMAGIHIVDPPRFVNMTMEEIAASSNSYGNAPSRWDWWRIYTTDADPAAGYPDYDAASFIQSSMDRLVPNGGVSLSKINSGTTWSIQATLNMRIIGLLESLHGPISDSANFIDWNGVLIEPGSTASPMKAALVSNDQAYLSFNVTSILGTSTPVTVLLATDLTTSQADDILLMFASS